MPGKPSGMSEYRVIRKLIAVNEKQVEHDTGVTLRVTSYPYLRRQERRVQYFEVAASHQALIYVLAGAVVGALGRVFRSVHRLVRQNR